MDRNKIKVLYHKQFKFGDLEEIEKALERFYLLPSIVKDREPLKRKIHVDSPTDFFVNDYYLGLNVPTFSLEDNVAPMYEIIGKKYST